MISDTQLKELQIYRDLERGLYLKASRSSDHLSSQGATSRCQFTVGFVSIILAAMLPALLAAYPPSERQCSLLDPYCGVGTTLLAAQMLQDYKLQSVGIEYNPFIRFVADTKTQWHLVDPSALERIGSRVWMRHRQRWIKFHSCQALNRSLYEYLYCAPTVRNSRCDQVRWKFRNTSSVIARASCRD